MYIGDSPKKINFYEFFLFPSIISIVLICFCVLYQLNLFIFLLVNSIQYTVFTIFLYAKLDKNIIIKTETATNHKKFFFSISNFIYINFPFVILTHELNELQYGHFKVHQLFASILLIPSSFFLSLNLRLITNENNILNLNDIFTNIKKKITPLILILFLFLLIPFFFKINNHIFILNYNNHDYICILFGSMINGLTGPVLWLLNSIDKINLVIFLYIVLPLFFYITLKHIHLDLFVIYLIYSIIPYLTGTFIWKIESSRINTI